MNHHRSTRPRPRSRLGIETLEDRTLPSGFWVTNLNDAGPGSLRQAVAEANAAGDLSTIRIAQTGVVILTGGPLVLTGSEQIIGPRADELVLRGNGSSRLLTITPTATVEIDGVTLENGMAEAGGAVDNAGTLTLSGCTLTGNQATPTVANANPNLPTGGGGAILNRAGATLTLDACTLTNNVANALNDTLDVFGGGVLNLGTATVTNSTFTGNQALGGGGSSFFAASCGGAIDNFGGATLTVTDSTFNSNQALGLGAGDFGIGGAIENNAGLQVSTPSTATISRSVFADNVASGPNGVYGNGGALDNEGSGTLMTVNDCTLHGNRSVGDGGANGIGGGIMNYASSTLTVTHTTFADNQALGSEGAGGAVENGNATASIGFSAFIGNMAGGITGDVGDVGGVGGFGGAINNDGLGAALSVNASTFRVNDAIGGGGGAIDDASTATATVANSSFIGNQALYLVTQPYGYMEGGGAINVSTAANANAQASVTVIGCTFINNIATDANGNVLAYAAISTSGSNAIVITVTAPIHAPITTSVTAPAALVSSAGNQVIPVTVQASFVPLFALGGGDQGSQQSFVDVSTLITPRPSDLPPLPTEREILAGMNVVGSLLRQTRPQANLVPQPGDPVAVVGALTPAPATTGPERAPSRLPAATTAPAWAAPVNPLLNAPIGPIMPVPIIGPTIPNQPHAEAVPIDRGGFAEWPSPIMAALLVASLVNPFRSDRSNRRRQATHP